MREFAGNALLAVLLKVPVKNKWRLFEEIRARTRIEIKDRDISVLSLLLRILSGFYRAQTEEIYFEFKELFLMSFELIAYDGSGSDSLFRELSDFHTVILIVNFRVQRSKFLF